MNLKYDYDKNIFEELIIISTGLADKPDSALLLKKICDLAINNSWPTLIRFFSQIYDDNDSQGSAANTLGIAFAKLDLPSHAYMAYSKAAEAGISVAKVNIAHQHLSQALPAAGLKILHEHVGEFDAADSAYPYYTRAELEKIVQQEREKSDRLYQEGKKLASLIKYFACKATSSNIVLPSKERLKMGEETFNLSIDDPAKIVLENNNDGNKIELFLVSPFIGLWCYSDHSSITTLCCFLEDKCMLKLTADLGDFQPI